MSAHATASRHRALFDGAVDLFRAGPGATLVFACLLLLASHWMPGGLGAALAYTLCLAFSFPHVGMTCLEVYARRENLVEHPVVTIWLPMILLTGAGMAIAAPAMLGPGLLAIYFAWSGLHHTQQTIALASDYCEQRLSRREQTFLAALLMFNFAFALAFWFLRPVPLVFYGLPLPELPASCFAVQHALPLLDLLALGGIVAWLCWRRWRDRRMSPGLAGVVATQVLWYQLLALSPVLMPLIPACHGLQALVAHSARGTRQHVPAREVRHQLLLAFLLGGALFEAIPAMLGVAGVPQNVAYAAVIVCLHLHHNLIEPLRWRQVGPSYASERAA